MRLFKQKYILITVAALILCAGTYYFAIYNTVRSGVVNSHGLYMGFESSDHLYEFSDLVVTGSTNESFNDRIHITTTFLTGATQDFYTITDLTVDKVIKGDVQPKATIQVGEPISYEQTLIGKYKSTIEGYTELKQNSKYLLFLKKNDQGLYFVIGSEVGKYNIDNTDPSDKASKNESKQKIKRELNQNKHFKNINI